MAIEKQAEKSRQRKLPEIYGEYIDRLTDEGLSMDEACDLLVDCHMHFYYDDATLAMIDERVKDVIDKLKLSGKQISDEESAKIANTLLESLRVKYFGDPKRKNKTLFVGAGGVEIKEDSKN